VQHSVATNSFSLLLLLPRNNSNHVRSLKRTTNVNCCKPLPFSRRRQNKLGRSQSPVLAGFPEHRDCNLVLGLHLPNHWTKQQLGDYHETSFKHICSKLIYKTMMHLQKSTIILRIRMYHFWQSVYFKSVFNVLQNFVHFHTKFSLPKCIQTKFSGPDCIQFYFRKPHLFE
jgi:hypothetical protein